MRREDKRPARYARRIARCKERLASIRQTVAHAAQIAKTCTGTAHAAVNITRGC